MQKWFSKQNYNCLKCKIFIVIIYIKSLVPCVCLSDVTFRGRIELCFGESFEVSRSMAEPASNRFYENVIMFKLHSAQQVLKPSVCLSRSWNPGPESQMQQHGSNRRRESRLLIRLAWLLKLGFLGRYQYIKNLLMKRKRGY